MVLFTEQQDRNFWWSAGHFMDVKQEKQRLPKATGVYGFPVKLAAHIAVNVVARFEQEFPKQIEEIYFVLFDRDTEAAYEKEVDKLY